MIVVDAAAAIEMFAPESRGGEWLRDRVTDSDMVHVPALFDLEVLNAVRRLEARGALRPSASVRALSHLADLRAVRHGHEHLRSRIWSLRHNLTAYDAAYVALAELLEVPLVTADLTLARSGPAGVKIEVPPV